MHKAKTTSYKFNTSYYNEAAAGLMDSHSTVEESLAQCTETAQRKQQLFIR